MRAPVPVRVSAWAGAQPGRAGVRAVPFPAPVLVVAWAEAQRERAGTRPAQMPVRAEAEEPAPPSVETLPKRAMQRVGQNCRIWTVAAETA